MPLRENYTNGEQMEDDHPDAHNDANLLVNQLQGLLGVTITDLGATKSRVTQTENDLLGAALSKAAHGVGFVNHGSNASAARPTDGYGMYIWIGTATPTNMANADLYFDVAP